MIRPKVHRLRSELRSVIAEKCFRNRPLQTNPAQHAHHVFSLETLPHFDRQTFSCEHIHHCQSSEPSPIRQLIGHKVQTPHLIRSYWLAALTAIRRRVSPFPPLVTQRQAFFPIQPVHQFLAHVPALALQQHPDLPIAITDSDLGDLANPRPKSGLRFAPALVSKCRFRDHGGAASSPLTHPVRAAQVVHHGPAARGLQNFFESTSCNMALSRLSSATSFFSLPFSSWSCFSCRT